jgi:hypothetical protein
VAASVRACAWITQTEMKRIAGAGAKVAPTHDAARASVLSLTTQRVRASLRIRGLCGWKRGDWRCGNKNRSIAPSSPGPRKNLGFAPAFPGRVARGMSWRARRLRDDACNEPITITLACHTPPRDCPQPRTHPDTIRRRARLSGSPGPAALLVRLLSRRRSPGCAPLCLWRGVAGHVLRSFTRPARIHPQWKCAEPPPTAAPAIGSARPSRRDRVWTACGPVCGIAHPVDGPAV